MDRRTSPGRARPRRPSSDEGRRRPSPPSFNRGWARESARGKLATYWAAKPCSCRPATPPSGNQRLRLSVGRSTGSCGRAGGGDGRLLTITLALSSPRSPSLASRPPPPCAPGLPTAWPSSSLGQQQQQHGSTLASPAVGRLVRPALSGRPAAGSARRSRARRRQQHHGRRAASSLIVLLDRSLPRADPRLSLPVEPPAAAAVSDDLRPPAAANDAPDVDDDDDDASRRARTVAAPSAARRRTPRRRDARSRLGRCEEGRPTAASVVQVRHPGLPSPLAGVYADRTDPTSPTVVPAARARPRPRRRRSSRSCASPFPCSAVSFPRPSCADCPSDRLPSGTSRCESHFPLARLARSSAQD